MKKILFSFVLSFCFFGHGFAEKLPDQEAKKLEQEVAHLFPADTKFLSFESIDFEQDGVLEYLVEFESETMLEEINSKILRGGGDRFPFYTIVFQKNSEWKKTEYQKNSDWMKIRFDYSIVNISGREFIQFESWIDGTGGHEFYELFWIDNGEERTFDFDNLFGLYKNELTQGILYESEYLQIASADGKARISSHFCYKTGFSFSSRLNYVHLEYDISYKNGEIKFSNFERVKDESYDGSCYEGAVYLKDNREIYKLEKEFSDSEIKKTKISFDEVPEKIKGDLENFDKENKEEKTIFNDEDTFFAYCSAIGVGNYAYCTGEYEGVFLTSTMQKIEGADRETFEALDRHFDSSPFAKDKNAMYKSAEKIEEVQDPKSAQIIRFNFYTNGSILKDDYNFYEYVQNDDRFQIKNFDFPIDPKSFQKVENSAYFTKDKDSIFNIQTPIKEADYETFEGLSALYSKDKNNAYYSLFGGEETLTIENIDSETFEVLHDQNYCLPLAKDKNFVYFKNVKNSDFDSSSLTFLYCEPAMEMNGTFLYDKNGIYRIQYSDNPSFEVSISKIYFSDFPEEFLKNIPEETQKVLRELDEKMLEQEDEALGSVSNQEEKNSWLYLFIGGGIFLFFLLALIVFKFKKPRK
jgi:hypothetical protein